MLCFILSNSISSSIITMNKIIQINHMNCILYLCFHKFFVYTLFSIEQIRFFLLNGDISCNQKLEENLILLHFKWKRVQTMHQDELSSLFIQCWMCSFCKLSFWQHSNELDVQLYDYLSVYCLQETIIHITTVCGMILAAM